MPFFDLTEFSPYYCQGCNLWYQPSGMSCMVIHPPGTCCHEYELRLHNQPPKPAANPIAHLIHCKDCVHWTAPVQEKEDANHADRAWDNFGTCDSEKFIRGYGRDLDDEATPDSVRVEDDEGWAFYTGPEFGCVHAKER